MKLLNEVTCLNKYVKFLVYENKNNEQETREDCRAEKEMLQERIEYLTAKIDDLKKQVKALESENAMLRKDSEESKSKLSEVEDLFQIKELNKCDLISIISVIQHRIFERNNDTTRFLDDSINPHITE
jgi:predicted  nucleic acid-binding Zn-ribbon protein